MKRRQFLLHATRGMQGTTIGLLFSPLVPSLTPLQAGQSGQLGDQLNAGGRFGDVRDVARTDDGD